LDSGEMKHRSSHHFAASRFGKYPNFTVFMKSKEKEPDFDKFDESFLLNSLNNDYETNVRHSRNRDLYSQQVRTSEYTSPLYK
jgi:hypothetical protein